MTEMQAAIGRVQLGKLDDWVAKRRELAEKLTEAFRTLPGLRVTKPGEDIFHAYYKYYTFVRPEELRDGWNRDRIMNEISARGVPCMSGICPEIYLEKAFSNSAQKSEIRGQKEREGQRDGGTGGRRELRDISDGRNLSEEARLPVARELGETSLMFLVHPTLTDEEIEKTCAVVAEVTQEACGE
jgi:dTDP-4-amino-4,6-dideoxygalactose transaminase